jgi:hypothetical protein
MAANRKPRPDTAWGIYNLGRLMDIAHRRKDAIAKCEWMVGKPWKECRKYMEVHKVRVTPQGASHDQ